MAEKILSKEDLFAATNPVIEYVELPSLKAGLYVRGMTALERDQFETMGMNKSGKLESQRLHGVRARTLLMGVCNKDGSPFFSQSSADLLRVNNLPAGVVDTLYKRILRLSGIGEDDQKEIEDRLADPTDASSFELA